VSKLLETLNIFSSSGCVHRSKNQKLLQKVRQKGRHDDDLAIVAGSTALHLASVAGMADVVSALIEMGATVSAADRHGYTALQRACQHNHAAVACMLIVQGNASPHRRVPENGNVPLHLAAELGHMETVQVFMSTTLHLSVAW